MAQMRTCCSIREDEEVKGDMMAELELGEGMRYWVEEERVMLVELQNLMNIVASLEDQKMERERVLKEEVELGRDENGEKLDVGKEFKIDDGSKDLDPDDRTLDRYDSKEDV